MNWRVPLKDQGIPHMLGRGATSPEGGGVTYSPIVVLGQAAVSSRKLSPGLETAQQNIERLIKETLDLMTCMGQWEDAQLTTVVDPPPHLVAFEQNV